MTKPRLAGLALALLVASTGLLPCLCMPSAEPDAAHCGSAEPGALGLSNGHHPCDCACLSAASESVASRVEPAFASAHGPAGAAPVLARHTPCSSFAPLASVDPPRAAPPPKLRI